MATVEILNVSMPKETPEEFWGSSIDAPKGGFKSELFMFPIRGWVLGRDSKAVAIEVVYEGGVIRKERIKEPSKDVEETHPEVAEAKNCRFHVVIGVLGFPREFRLVLRAVLEDGRRIRIGSLKARHQPVRSSFKPQLQPTMLTSLNRVGSTWMMGILAAHPQIVVYQHYPYEHSTAQYWVHMLKVLSEPANPIQSAKPGDFHNDLWHVGHNPFFDRHVLKHPLLGEWIGREYIERVAELCQTSIEDWYLRVARSQGQDQPAYFAEKGVAGHIPALTWELYPNAKEIFLVRDFRDMVCSLMAFYKNGTTRGRAENDEQYIQWLGGWAEHLHGDYETRADRAHLVRYEDLVVQPVETLTSLFRYLELDCSPDLVDEIIKKAGEQTPHFRQHRTTPNVEASIGRWQRDLDPELQRACEETFADLLGAFGYTS